MRTTSVRSLISWFSPSACSSTSCACDRSSASPLCCLPLALADEYDNRTVGSCQLGAHAESPIPDLTLKKETTWPPGKNILQQQARFEAFVKEFNEERPQEALDLKVPAELYTSPSRTYEGLPTKKGQTRHHDRRLKAEWHHHSVRHPSTARRHGHRSQHAALAALDAYAQTPCWMDRCAHAPGAPACARAIDACDLLVPSSRQSR